MSFYKHFEQDRSMILDCQIECNKFVYVINKLIDNKEKVLPFLKNEICEFHIKRKANNNLMHKIDVYKGIIKNILIPRLNDLKFKIKQLIQLIPSEAVLVFCLYKYQLFNQSDGIISDIFSNYLISSKFISLLCDKDIDVELFGLEITTTLKKIEHLKKEINQINLHIQKYEQKIDKCYNDLTFENSFNRVQLRLLLGINKLYFSDFDEIPNDVLTFKRGYTIYYYCIDESAEKLYNVLMDYCKYKLKELITKYINTLDKINNPHFDKSEYISTYHKYKEYLKI